MDDDDVSKSKRHCKESGKLSVAKVTKKLLSPISPRFGSRNASDPEARPLLGTRRSTSASEDRGHRPSEDDGRRDVANSDGLLPGNQEKRPVNLAPSSVESLHLIRNSRKRLPWWPPRNRLKDNQEEMVLPSQNIVRPFPRELVEELNTFLQASDQRRRNSNGQYLFTVH